MTDRPLTISINRESGTLVLKCTGAAEAETIDGLEIALDAIHADALQAHAKAVIVDLTELERASEPCLTRLAAWIQRVTALDEDARYEIVVRWSARHAWQGPRLVALATAGARLVEIA